MSIFPIGQSQGFSCRIWQTDSKITCKHPKPGRAKETLKNKNEFGDLTLPDF